MPGLTMRRVQSIDCEKKSATVIGQCRFWAAPDVYRLPTAVWPHESKGCSNEYGVAPSRYRPVGINTEENMLVLSRRPGEEVVIAGNIRVTIIAAKGDRVRIGIVAPPSVIVDRKEIHDLRAEWAGQKARPKSGRPAGQDRFGNLHSGSPHT